MIDAHPFLDGKPKRMLIDGKWLDAASGKTFETFNPATGEVRAHVTEGDAEDIDRAVAAARRAFNGPWSKFKPADRQRLLLKLADLVERGRGEHRAGLRRPAVPFGGNKMSGYSRESGVQHLEDYLNVKSVWIKTDCTAADTPSGRGADRAA